MQVREGRCCAAFRSSCLTLLFGCRPAASLGTCSPRQAHHDLSAAGAWLRTMIAMIVHHTVALGQTSVVQHMISLHGCLSVLSVLLPCAGLSSSPGY